MHHKTSHSNADISKFANVHYIINLIDGYTIFKWFFIKQVPNKRYYGTGTNSNTTSSDPEWV